jgi:hypothetical protein
MIPIRSVYQLQLPIKRKLGVIAIFLVGLMWVVVRFRWEHVVLILI